MSQTGTDESGTPPKLKNNLENQTLRESSVRRIEKVNKNYYINNWLHKNSSSSSSNDIPTNNTKKSVSTKETSCSSSSACVSKPVQVDKSPAKPQLFPAGYNLGSVYSKSKGSGSTNSRKLHASTKNSPPIKKNIEKIDQEQTKTDTNNTQVNSEQSPQVDSEWKDLFDKQDEFQHKFASGNHSNNHSKIKKHIKHALGLCMCAECEQDIPADLVYPEVEKFSTREPPERKRPPPLMKANDSQITSVMTAPVKRSQALEGNKTAVLTHGHTVPQPQDEINKTNLLPAVQEKLKRAGYERSKPVQSFGWPAIMRGNNVVMIHKKETGKTLTYITALCSFLMDQEGLYDNIPDSKRSPLMIVLCNNATIAEDVHMKFADILKGNKLLDNIWLPLLPLSKKDISQFFGRKPPKTFNKYKSYKHNKAAMIEYKLDVVITTVDTLIVLLNDNIIDLKRLRHFVVENLNIILDKLKKGFELLLGAVDSMLSHRNCYDGVQFVSTGEKWTTKVEEFVCRLDNFPLIIIGNPMQAALYGRAQFHLQYVQNKLKPETLIELLKSTHYHVHKCIVVCKLEEVKILEDRFATKGISFVSTTDEMTGGQAMELLMSWKSTSSGKHIVLICTDKSLRQYVKISNATFLINYSLPPTWSLFSQRFSILIDSYQCPLTSSYSQNKFNCHVVTYVDENCQDRFPRLSNFFKVNNIKVPDVLLRFCEQEKQKEEQENVANNAKICKSIFTYGVCGSPECKERHIFTPKLETPSNTPSNGKITCRFINMKAVNQYYLQILEYMDLQGETHHIEDYSTKVSELLKEKSAFEPSVDAIKGKMYLYADDNQFNRCVINRVVKYVSIGDTMTPDPLEVEVFGLENGIKLTINFNQLYKIPKSLEDIPPSVVEVYIARLIPPFKESLWTRNASKTVYTKIKSFNKSTICVGNILLRLNDTIWVDDLQLRETNTPFPNRLSITQFLKDRNIYDKYEDSLANLYKLCLDGGISLPEYKVFLEEKPLPKLTQAEANWAFLNPDELNAVYFVAATSSDCLYVRQTKFYSLLKKLEDNITSSLHLLRRKLDKDEIVIGCYYCLPDEVSGNWCRVKLIDVQDNIAKCFYVDYGDFVSAPVENLKLLSDEFITKLPFQAIECSLYGVQPTASSELIDALHEQSYEENTDYFKTLYAMILSTEKSVYGDMKYKIMLLDYYSGEVSSINSVLLRLNLAAEIPGERLDEIELLPSSEIPDVSHEEEYINNDAENFVELKDDDFDFISYDYNPYAEADKMALDKTDEPSKDKPKEDIGYIPMTAVVNTNKKLLPKVTWYQTELNIFLEFSFIDNQDYKLYIVRNRFLSFNSIYEDKHYELSINLYNAVSKQFVHESKTHFIQAVLTKQKAEDWPRLVKSEEKMSNIKYKFDKIAVDSDEDEDEDEKKNLLQCEEIDDEYFKDAIYTAEGHVEEIWSDYDSDSDYEALNED